MDEGCIVIMCPADNKLIGNYATRPDKSGPVLTRVGPLSGDYAASKVKLNRFSTQFPPISLSVKVL
jgi:hypothetical protein